MKKIIAALLALAMAFCLCACGEKEPEVTGTKVFVTISSEGKLSLAEEVIAVDADGDGTTTICEALSSAHEQFYDGGAEKGFGSENTDYGISLTKLWGVENGVYGYGYYLNNASPQSLLDPVKEGDYIAAYSYADLDGWSDVYSWFDAVSYDADGGKVKLTLKSLSFDADWNPVEAPAEGVVITIDGADTEFRTGADGTAEISISAKGEHVISARSEDMTMVAPGARVSVK